MMHRVVRSMRACDSTSSSASTCRRDRAPRRPALAGGEQEVAHPEREAVDDDRAERLRATARCASSSDGDVDRRLQRLPVRRPLVAMRVDARAHLVVERLSGRDEQHAAPALALRRRASSAFALFPGAHAAEQQRETRHSDARSSPGGPTIAAIASMSRCSTHRIGEHVDRRVDRRKGRRARQASTPFRAASRTKQCATKRRILEQAVHVRADDEAVGRARAVAALGRLELHREWRREVRVATNRALRAAHVNLVGIEHAGPSRAVSAASDPRVVGRPERVRRTTRPRTRRVTFSGANVVVTGSSPSAVDGAAAPRPRLRRSRACRASESRRRCRAPACPALRRATIGVGESAFAKPREVGDRRLGAGNDDQIRIAELVRIGDEAHRDAGLARRAAETRRGSRRAAVA